MPFFSCLLGEGELYLHDLALAGIAPEDPTAVELDDGLGDV